MWKMGHTRLPWLYDGCICGGEGRETLEKQTLQPSSETQQQQETKENLTKR